MIELWLVISTACFNALTINTSTEYWGNPFRSGHICFDNVYIYIEEDLLVGDK